MSLEKDRFEQAGLSLRIFPDNQNDPLGQVDVQTGKSTEIGQGKMLDVHPG